MSKIKVIQTRSAIGRDQRTHDALRAIGLGKIGKEKILPNTKAVAGMVHAVRHLVEVQTAEVQVVSKKS